MEGVGAGSIVRLLTWSNGGAGDGEMRRYVLRLLNMPPPAYGPPGTTVDPTVPRDLYRTLGTGRPAPGWVRRANLATFVVCLLFVAAFGWSVDSWGLPGLVFLWLAYMSLISTRGLMLLLAPAIRTLDGFGTDVLLAALASAGPVVVSAVLWLLETHHFFV